MLTTPTDRPWYHQDWTERAQAWIRMSLAEAGYTLTGPIEQVHVRLWSTVMRFPSDAGLFYFKACDPLTEPRLTVFLSRVQPENIPDLVSVDLEQGWMIMRDAGPMLRTYLKSAPDLRLIEPALLQFADLQMAIAAQPEPLLAMGALDRRLERLPELYAQMLSDHEILRLGESDGLTSPQHSQLRALLPRYTEMCHQLQTYHVPQTLHHDDFHDGNIFLSQAAGRYRFVFSDWGESCLAHPFFSMMLCLRSVGGRAGFPDEATEAPDRMPPELNHLRDVYLQPWQRYESPERLVEAFNLAWRVGMISRALSWRAYISSLDVPSRASLTYIVPAWLGEFLLAMQ